MTPLVLLLLTALPATSPRATVALSGRVLGASDQHPVLVALWRRDGFLEAPVRVLRIAPGEERTFSFEVEPGRWALSAFEDRNGNGVLDMGAFGPKEPAGFWRPFHGWRRPRFDEVAADVERDVPDADIHLR